MTRDQVCRELITAQEALDRETYRLNTIELDLDIIQSELEKLESPSAASFMASLLGTKADKIAVRREALEDLKRDREECEQGVQNLAKAADAIRAQLAEFPDVEEDEPQPTDQTNEPATPGQHPSAHDLRCALDAGQSVLNGLAGAYKLCNHLRKGPNMFGARGVLLSTAVQAFKNKTANTVAGQIAGTIRHFRDQLVRLNLSPDFLPDIFVLIPQIEAFVEASSLGRDAGVDAWAELEAMTRSIVGDLEEALAKVE